MTNNISDNPNDALVLMIIAVVLSVLIMMLFANPVGTFVSKHPSIQILGLSFLLLIGFMLRSCSSVTFSCFQSRNRQCSQGISLFCHLFFFISGVSRYENEKK